MSKIRLHGTSSGYVEIAPAAAASNNTLTAPSTVGEIIAKDAAGAIGITSMKASNVNVGAAVTITESGIEASGIGITVANINGGQIGGRRNLVINGDMRVAQRGTSSTSSNGFYMIDRYWQYNQDTDEAPTFSQVDVSSGTPAYQAGFRKALRITNGNQTSGAGVSDQIQLEYRFEAQDIANSGWNYTSSTSFLTLSFYIKSSVAQAFNLFLKTEDGTEKNMPLSTPSLTADTWTRVIFRIKGDSGISFNDDEGKGLSINITPFTGTNYTDNSITNGEWIAWSSATRYRDVTSTWYTTNDATLEFTGLQLEVGPEATAFEHRSKGDELQLCQRYYQTGFAKLYNANQPIMVMSQNFMPEMRSAPTITGEQFESETNAIWSSIEVTTSRACAFYKNGEICQRWKCDAEL